MANILCDNMHPLITGAPQLLESRLYKLCDHLYYSCDGELADRKHGAGSYLMPWATDTFNDFLANGWLETIHLPNCDPIVAEAFLRELSAVWILYSREINPRKEELKKAITQIQRAVNHLKDAESAIEKLRSNPGGEKLLSEMSQLYSKKSELFHFYIILSGIKRLTKFFQHFDYEKLLKKYKAAKTNKLNRIGLVAAIANSYWYCFETPPTSTLGGEFSKTIETTYRIFKIHVEEEALVKDLKNGIKKFKELKSE